MKSLCFLTCSNKKSKHYSTIGDKILGEDEIDVNSSTGGDDFNCDEDERYNSSARVPAPKRYTFPRHVTVDEPVNAL